jgi:hypothetical protein
MDGGAKLGRRRYAETGHAARDASHVVSGGLLHRARPDGVCVGGSLLYRLRLPGRGFIYLHQWSEILLSFLPGALSSRSSAGSHSMARAVLAGGRWTPWRRFEPRPGRPFPGVSLQRIAWPGFPWESLIGSAAGLLRLLPTRPGPPGRPTGLGSRRHIPSEADQGAPSLTINSTRSSIGPSCGHSDGRLVSSTGKRQSNDIVSLFDNTRGRMIRRLHP